MSLCINVINFRHYLTTYGFGFYLSEESKKIDGIISALANDTGKPLQWILTNVVFVRRT